ncbi:MAG: methyltransferase family protein [bacterium]
MKLTEWPKRTVAYGGIILFFIMAFEVMIMISPFAFFFYSVFNPVFQWLDHFAITRWLTFFFLPHMIFPPNLFLQSVRILGSVFFVVGALMFIVCALQVYLGKIFKWGIAQKGLYAYIRHPQYSALAIWGLGMAILWPRFIVLTTLSLMMIVYYFLARDEERRMLNQYGAAYQGYMAGTGRFLPRFTDNRISTLERLFPSVAMRSVVIPVLIVTTVMGGGFLGRAFTLDSLAFQAKKNLTLISILPEDRSLSPKAIAAISRGEANGNIDFMSAEQDYLGYLMPADYVMQGMIANTGSEFHLYKKHHTVAMISDWVLHPFEHLRRSPSVHMAKMHQVDPRVARRHQCPLGIDEVGLSCETCPYRRVVLVQVKHPEPEHVAGAKLLAFDTVRTPVGFVDVNTQTGEILDAHKVENATAWKDVPTPAL